MTANGSNVDPELEAAIERALDAAQLRAGDATASVVHLEPGDSVVVDRSPDDGD